MIYTDVRRMRPGFSLMELMIVIAIIGVLGAVLVPSMYKYLGRSQEASTTANLRAIKMELDRYFGDVHSYPDKLRDLVKKPAEEQIAKKWRGSYLDSLPLDAWDVSFQYKKSGEKGHPYELFSWGPNGKTGSKEERISVWNL